MLTAPEMSPVPLSSLDSSAFGLLGAAAGRTLLRLKRCGRRRMRRRASSDFLLGWRWCCADIVSGSPACAARGWFCCAVRAAGARRSARAAGSFGTTFLRAICILNLGARASAAGKLPAGQASSNETLEAVLLAYWESPMVVSTRARTAWERYFTER